MQDLGTTVTPAFLLPDSAFLCCGSQTQSCSHPQRIYWRWRRTGARGAAVQHARQNPEPRPSALHGKTPGRVCGPQLPIRRPQATRAAALALRAPSSSCQREVFLLLEQLIPQGSDFTTQESLPGSIVPRLPRTSEGPDCGPAI